MPWRKTIRTNSRAQAVFTLRQIHEQVRKSVARDHEAQKMKNALAQGPGRWQRFVRYVWDRQRS